MLTKRFYDRIRTVADEHAGRLDVTLQDDLPEPVLALPHAQSELAPQLFVSNNDYTMFRWLLNEELRPATI